MASLGGVASAAPQSASDSTESASTSNSEGSDGKFECDPTYSDTGHGANQGDNYDNTCESEHEPGNGQESGPGNHTGRPCAGCVGNADDKNPPGQYPDGSDHNSGYECDGRDRPFKNQNGNGNHGVGDENPAHTGCQPAAGEEPGSETGGQPPTCPDGSAMPSGATNCSGPSDCPAGGSGTMPGDAQRCGPAPCPGGAAMGGSRACEPPAGDSTTDEDDSDGESRGADVLAGSESNNGGADTGVSTDVAGAASAAGATGGDRPTEVLKIAQFTRSAPAALAVTGASSLLLLIGLASILLIIGVAFRSLHARARPSKDQFTAVLA